MKRALLIFTRHPEAGKVKTRLAATIGNDAALSIYTQLVKHTVSITKDLPVDKFVFYADEVMPEDLWHTAHYCKDIQKGNDLGERMKDGFDNIFRKGYDMAVIIGTDCPGLSAPALMNAFDSLNSYDVVIGPATDGGYYLLGMKQPCHPLFEDIHWSTGSVLEETLKRCSALHLKYTLLPVLQDIDEEKDLKQFKLQEQ
jgi:uncharacterized protein